MASNAAKDATQLVAKLRAFHNRSQQDKTLEHLKWFSLIFCCKFLSQHKNYRAGLDLENGDLLDNREAGIFEPLMSKVKSLKFATEAAITILRIDDLIKLDKIEKKQRGDDCCE